MSDDASFDDRIASLEREVAELRQLLQAAQARPDWLPQRMTNTGNGMCDSCRATINRGGTAVCGCVLYGQAATCTTFQTAVQTVIGDSVRKSFLRAGTSTRA